MGTVKIPPGTDLNGASPKSNFERKLLEIGDYRFNTISGFPEIKFKKEGQKWKRLDDYTLNWSGRAGYTYFIEHSEDLELWDWEIFYRSI